MAYDYIFPNQPMRGLEFDLGQESQESQETPLQQQMSQTDPKAIASIARTFIGKTAAGVEGVEGVSAAAEVGTGVEGLAAAEGIGVGAEGGAAGTEGVAAGKGVGSAISAAGPWAALAAVIFANEYMSVKDGYRDENRTQYTKDLFSGEVFHQDMEQKFGNNLFGFDEDSKQSKRFSFAMNPMGTADWKKSWERFKDMF